MQTIIDQFNDMLQRGKMPLFEIEIINTDGERDWLIVDIELHEKGIVYRFDDMDLPVWFDGNTVQLNAENNGCQLVPFDEYFTDMHYYLEYIIEDIMEGFIIPNGLYCNDEA